MADDYIKRKDAVDIMLSALSDDWEEDYAYDRLDEIHAADVVEIVRYKDCKFRPSLIDHKVWFPFPNQLKCPCECDDYQYSWIPDDDWFCANGARREENDG